MSQTNRISKNNTKIVRNDDGSTSVFLHGTEIVKIWNSGEITLNSGGWMTVTTKARMNQVSNEWNLHFQVFQTKNVWFVSTPSDVLKFKDGMSI